MYTLLILFCSLLSNNSHSFLLQSRHVPIRHIQKRIHPYPPARQSTRNLVATTTTSPIEPDTSSSFLLKSQFTTVFDFTQTESNGKNQSLASFERIDDAIMGGISLSKLADVQGQDYVRWNGVCRTDGGYVV